MPSFPKMSNTALIVVDTQDCFISEPGAELAIPGAISILPFIRRLLSLSLYSLIVFTQDTHPPNHISFASTHGMQPGETVQLAACDDCSGQQQQQQISQRLWPDHCIKGTPGWELHPDLGVTVMAAQEAQQEMQRGDEGHRCSTILPVSVAGVRTEAIVVQKGQCREQDAYSAFFNNGRLGETGLHAFLQDRNVQALHVVGVALDVCVLYAALDAADLGYDVSVLLDGCAATSKEAKEMAVQRLKATNRIRVV